MNILLKYRTIVLEHIVGYTHLSANELRRARLTVKQRITFKSLLRTCNISEF